MKNLFLLQGIPGCGKSTFIKNNQLEKYTVNIDDLRIEIGGLVEREVDGVVRMTINHEVSREAFMRASSLVENKMQNAETVILDAQNITKGSVRPFTKLANQYEYNVYFVDMQGDLSLNEILKRNAEREPHKYVPIEIIETSFQRLLDSKTRYPQRTIISPSEMLDVMEGK